MIVPLRPTARWPDVVIVVATIALAVLMVQRADGEFRRTMPPPAVSRPHPVARPAWVWTLEYPYRRVQHGLPSACAAATLGVGALLARDGRLWTRRGQSRHGTMVVLVLLLVGGSLTALELLKASALGRSTGLSFTLSNALEFRLQGAILGVWVVAWLRPSRGAYDWRERAARLVGWSCMASAGLLIAYGVLFG